MWDVYCTRYVMSIVYSVLTLGLGYNVSYLSIMLCLLGPPPPQVICIDVLHNSLRVYTLSLIQQ